MLRAFIAGEAATTTAVVAYTFYTLEEVFIFFFEYLLNKNVFLIAHDCTMCPQRCLRTLNFSFVPLGRGGSVRVRYTQPMRLHTQSFAIPKDSKRLQ